MALILSIETATHVCSVALHQEGRLLASAELYLEQSHASKLALLIENLFSISGYELDDLSAVAISCGPGSYTGLRIGTSTAKGICFGLSIPLIAIGSLEALAFQINQLNYAQALLCPMIDARRMEVYCMVVDSSLQIIQPTGAKIIDESSFLDVLNNHTILFFGNGADKCQQIIAHPNAHFLKGINLNAVAVGVLAYAKFADGVFEDVSKFEPFYGKDFVAKKAKSLLGDL